MEQRTQNKTIGLSLTHVGFEDASKSELKSLKATKIETGNGWVSYSAQSLEHLCSIAYACASTTKTLYLLKSISGSTLKSLLDGMKGIDFRSWIHKGASFRVNCSDLPESNISKTELNEHAGEVILNTCQGSNAKVDLVSPQVIFHIYSDSKSWFVGVDLTGIDISSRDYKLFLLSTAPKGTLAASLLLKAGYKGRGVLIDPFCRGGVIAIEAAAMLSGTPINKYRQQDFAFTKLPNGSFKGDKFFEKAERLLKPGNGNIFAFSEQFREIAGAKKNAKIANLNNEINFSRLEVDWLDTKFDKNSVDFIVTLPPQASKNRKSADVYKLLQELLVQSEYCLKKSGVLAVLLRETELISKAIENTKLKIVSQTRVRHGKAEKEVLLIMKQ